MTIAEALTKAEQLLAERGVPNARFDAEVLLAHAAQQNRAWLVTHGTDPLDPGLDRIFQETIARRARREPLQYLLGTQEFWGLEFRVTPAVLIPRPETELVVETALQRLAGRETPVIVDLCTGSGCIAVSLAHEKPHARVFAIDSSPEALAVARENARRHETSGRIRFFEGDLFAPLGELSLAANVDIVTANPPYVPAGDYEGLQPEVRDYEPQAALLAGPAGTDVALRIVADAPAYLRPGGLLIMEMGIGQADALQRAIADIGQCRNIAVLQDLAGIDRVIVAERQ